MLTRSSDLNRVRDDGKYGNTPLVFGEWALSTQFAASDSFLRKWADAQKFAYSRGGGWMVGVYLLFREPWLMMTNYYSFGILRLKYRVRIIKQRGNGICLRFV